MIFLVHSLLLMTLLDKISTCNAFPLENHTDHQKQENSQCATPDDFSGQHFLVTSLFLMNMEDISIVMPVLSKSLLFMTCLLKSLLKYVLRTFLIKTSTFDALF